VVKNPRAAPASNVFPGGCSDCVTFLHTNCRFICNAIDRASTIGNVRSVRQGAKLKHRLKCVACTALLALVGSHALAIAGPVCEVLRPSPIVSPPEVDPYEELSVSKLQKLASQSDGHAMSALGVRYGTGTGVKRNAVKSFEYYKDAAAKGFPQGQVNLAYMYLNGEGTPKNLNLAYSWARKAAEVGDAGGLAFVGYMLGTGTGVEQGRARTHGGILR